MQSPPPRSGGPGPAVSPFFSPVTARPGVLAAGGRPRPARPPGSGRTMAPRLRLVRRAPPPSQLRWPGVGGRCVAEASPRAGRSSGFPGRGGVGWGRHVLARLAPLQRLRAAPLRRQRSALLPSRGPGARSCPRPRPGFAGLSTNLCRALRWLPARSGRRRRAPGREASHGSAGTHLSGAQAASVSVGTPRL
jgi:hypothetical protein